MTASSVTGVGSGSVEQGLPPYRSLGQTLKLRSGDDFHPLFNIVDGNYVEEGGVQSSFSTYRTIFTNDELINHNLLVQHNLGNMYVAATTIYDDTNKVIIPDEIEVIDANSLLIYFTNFVVSGTWHLIIIS